MAVDSDSNKSWEYDFFEVKGAHFDGADSDALFTVHQLHCSRSMSAARAKYLCLYTVVQLVAL